MTQNSVSDELWKAFLVEYVKADGRMRDALEAVAPMIIAQLMRDAANGTLDEETIRTIAARAQELDPQ
jgi:hypothetical protein